MTTIINNLKLTVYNTSALPSTFVKSVLSISPFRRRAKWGIRDSCLPRVSCYKVVWCLLHLNSNLERHDLLELPFHPDVCFSFSSALFFLSHILCCVFLLGEQRRSTLLELLESKPSPSRSFLLKNVLIPCLWRLQEWALLKFDHWDC